jgi:HEAT repeat protein
MLLQLGACAFAQRSGIQSSESVTEILTKLRDPTWEKRAEAFYETITNGAAATWDGRADLIPSRLAALFRAHPDREDDLKLALIDLLNMENSVVEAQAEEYKKSHKTLTEAYTNYYGDVIAAVSGLNDPRALNALVGAITTGGMATNGLARLGSGAIDPVIVKLQSPDVIVRAATVRALTTMWQPETRDKFSDSASRQKIRDAILKAARDEDGGVRLAAVYGLALMPDDETIAVLKSLAASDPSRLPGQADEGGPFYPVRQAAKRVLDQIAHSGASSTKP